jgi:hypothetical protein
MSNQFIKQLSHQPVKPVEIERLPGDVLYIEGVRYAGELFRTMAFPSDECLYAIRRDGDNVVLTTIRNIEEARKFFQEIGQEEPVHSEVDDAV